MKKKIIISETVSKELTGVDIAKYLLSIEVNKKDTEKEKRHPRKDV